MRGWFLARLELAIAAIGVIVVIAIPILYPAPTSMISPFPAPPVLFTLMPIAAGLMAVFGLGWMVRIWRGPTRDLPPSWRYRDRA